MIINHTHKFVFVHVPKAAGTSVSGMFRTLMTYRDLEVGTGQMGREMQGIYARHFGLTKHAPASRIREVMGIDDWEAYFTIGFARNPFSRLLSIYHFLKTWKQLPEADAKALEAFPTFEDFVAGDLWRVGAGPSGIYRPQTFWLTSRNKPQELAVDFVGRQETLAEDMEKIAARIGPGIRFDTARRSNVTPSYSREVAWSDEGIARVVERYRRDFDLLGYATRPGD